MTKKELEFTFAIQQILKRWDKRILYKSTGLLETNSIY